MEETKIRVITAGEGMRVIGTKEDGTETVPAMSVTIAEVYADKITWREVTEEEGLSIIERQKEARVARMGQKTDVEETASD